MTKEEFHGELERILGDADEQDPQVTEDLARDFESFDATLAAKVRVLAAAYASIIEHVKKRLEREP